MGDHDHGGAGALDPIQGAEQRRLAFLVEARIGLVEHQQARPAEQGAGEADALALAAREMEAALADLGLVAVRQAQDHVVHAGEARSLDDVVGIGVGEAPDVVLYGAAEQGDVLRQVADVAADLGAIQRREVGGIEPHVARAGCCDAGQQAAERALAGRRRADHAQQLARCQGKRDLLQQGPAAVRGA